MQIEPFQRKTGKWTFFACSVYWVLQGYLQGVLVCLWGNASLLFFVVLLIEAPLAFRASFFCTHPLDLSLKNWGTRVEVPTSRRSWELRVPSWLCGIIPGVWFVVRACLSLFYLLSCEYFLIYQIYRNYSAIFWISLRGNCCVYSCKISASVGGGEPRNLFCCHLGWLYSRISLHFSMFQLSCAVRYTKTYICWCL